MSTDLPSGTVTFLFTDIEGSTRLLQRLGERYADALGAHRKLLRAAFNKFHGHEVDTQGDSFFVAFARAADAIAASVMAQRALAEHAWHEGESVRVRMGLHTGAPQLTPAGYVGLDVHIAARLCAAAHGGQVVLSQATHDLAEQLQLDDVTMRELGEHRLKDLDQPRRIFQLVISNLPDEFPPLRTLDTHPHNLPIQLTSFVGREGEINELKEILTIGERQQTTDSNSLVRRPSSVVRLLTLTGAGGAGKTRLALQVAAEVVDSFKNGVWFIELAPLADPALIAGTVATTLGLREQSGQPILDSLIEYLRTQEILLVLDNCEHLIEACARFADVILRACPNLRMLATSREALGIAGETTWIVPSLSLPDAQQPRPTFSDLSQYEAVQLFVTRAVAAQPTFKLTELNAAPVAHVCQRLDGIPLAIELAAARVRVLKTAEIAARLDDRFRLLSTGNRMALPRHQTLRGTIDWSFDLLSESERVALRRLSVFAGGCTLEAVEEVCGDDGRLTTDDEGAGFDYRPPSQAKRIVLRRDEVLDLLSHLVDKSLVVVDKHGDETRYRMLETIREYARERLEEGGEAEAVRQRHAEFLLELVERVPATMTNAERKARYQRFDAEMDNLRAAMGWALATHHAELGLRLVGALGEYWFWWASRWNEGWSWISQFLALPEAMQPKRARANALKGAVNLVRYTGDPAKANRLGDESLALFRELGDKSGMAWVLVDKGTDAEASADYTRAALLCQESATLFREIGDQRGLGWALNWLASAVKNRGGLEEAATLYKESVAAGEAGGDDAMTGMIHMGLADLAYNTRDYARATELYHQAMALCREGSDPDGANYALLSLGVTALAQGDLGIAALHLEASEAWFRQANQKLGLSQMLHYLGYVRHLQGDDRAAMALLREAIALQRQRDGTGSLIKSFEWSACVSADSNQPQRAARLFGAAESARERIGAPLPPGDKPMYDRHLERVRADLEESAFDAAWAEGRAMILLQNSGLALEQAIEYALEMPLTPEDGVLQLKRQAAKQEFGGLTEREREVAARIAQGETNREIAKELVVTERTVETHVTNILNKLGFTSRAQIRKWAVEKGLGRNPVA